MAPEINTMREALNAEVKAHRVTKDELQLTTQRLAKATEAKTYAITKANQQMEEHERKLREVHEKHTSEKKATEDENVRLLARVQALEKENSDLEVTKQKLQRYNEQQEHNVKSLSFRLKIAKSAPSQAPEGPGDFSGKKRKAGQDEEDEDEDEDKVYPCHKKPKTATVACTHCVTHNWEDCDGGPSCQNCILRKRGDCCKRVMCKRYKKNTCSNLFCTLAHEGNVFTNLVPFTRLQKMKEKTPSPLEQKAARDAQAKRRVHKKNTESEGMYDGLFEDLEKNRKKRSGGDDFGAGGYA